jgi:hypothetical protein
VLAGVAAEILIDFVLQKGDIGDVGDRRFCRAGFLDARFFTGLV